MTKKKTTPEEEERTFGTQESVESPTFVETATPEAPDADVDSAELPAESDTIFDDAVPMEAVPNAEERLPDCEILSAEPEPIRRGEPNEAALLGAAQWVDTPTHLPHADATSAEDPFVSPVVPETADKSTDRTPYSQAVPNAGADRRAFYQLDFHELDRGLTTEEQQEWNAIYASYRGRSVLTGTVVGIDLHAIRVRDKDTGELRRQEMYCAIVIPFRVRILIPETEMWTKGEERPGFVLRNIVGAKLDMVIVQVDRESGFAIGSRRMALGSRQYYFSNRPNLNQPGSRVKCSVLTAGPRRCLVTCHGYDVSLTQRELRYSAIPDLRDAYHPGDELDCIVKAYDREQGRLTVSVKETQSNPFDGAQLRHPIGSRRGAVIAGKYAGGVFCNLPDGAVCMCSYSYHYEDGEFAVGDKVIVIPQRYENEKKQIYGKIVAKW